MGARGPAQRRDESGRHNPRAYGHDLCGAGYWVVVAGSEVSAAPLGGSAALHPGQKLGLLCLELLRRYDARVPQLAELLEFRSDVLRRRLRRHRSRWRVVRTAAMWLAPRKVK